MTKGTRLTGSDSSGGSQDQYRGADATQSNPDGPDGFEQPYYKLAREIALPTSIQNFEKEVRRISHAFSRVYGHHLKHQRLIDSIINLSNTDFLTNADDRWALEVVDDGGSVETLVNRLKFLGSGASVFKSADQEVTVTIGDGASVSNFVMVNLTADTLPFAVGLVDFDNEVEANGLELGSGVFSGQVALKAGRVYLLIADLDIDFANSGDTADFEFDTNPAVAPNPTGVLARPFEANGGGTRGRHRVSNIFAPTVDTHIWLSLVTATNPLTVKEKSQMVILDLGALNPEETLSYIEASGTTQPTDPFEINDHLAFDTIHQQFDLPLDTASLYTTILGANTVGRFTLKAYRTYVLMGHVLLSDATPIPSAGFSWYDATNGQYLNNSNQVAQIDNSDRYSHAFAIVRPSSNILVELRCLNLTGDIDGFDNYYCQIFEIGRGLSIGDKISDVRKDGTPILLASALNFIGLPVSVQDNNGIADIEIDPLQIFQDGGPEIISNQNIKRLDIGTGLQATQVGAANDGRILLEATGGGGSLPTIVETVRNTNFVTLATSGIWNDVTGWEFTVPAVGNYRIWAAGMLQLSGAAGIYQVRLRLGLKAGGVGPAVVLGKTVVNYDHQNFTNDPTFQVSQPFHLIIPRIASLSAGDVVILQYLFAAGTRFEVRGSVDEMASIGCEQVATV